MPRPAPIRPPALLPGDTVGIVAPASCFDRNAFLAGCARLEQLGYKPYYLDSIFERDLYFAGTVQRRVQELEHMFTNPDVQGIVCVRGGYGANYLLPHLDVKKVLANPKVFVGYSDITALHTWFNDHGLVTFHGPMVSADFARADGVDLATWNAATRQAAPQEVAMPAEVVGLKGGAGEGTLYGGCLSILVASLGTKYELHTEESILFLEDINAKPYQVDRMLMQLKYAGKFDRVRGVLFGAMLDCTQPGGQDYTLQQVIMRVLSDLDIPIAYGYPSGHVNTSNAVLPFGVKARFAVNSQVRLTVDAAVAQGEGRARVIRESSAR